MSSTCSLCFVSGGSCRQPVWHPCLSVRGAVPELADPRATVASLRQAAGHLRLLLLLRPAPLDRQLRPHLRLRVGVLPVLRLPAVHQVGDDGVVCWFVQRENEFECKPMSLLFYFFYSFTFIWENQCNSSICTPIMKLGDG